MPPADRPIPAAPCPTCRRPPEAWSGDVGRVVRCAGCDTRFRIALVAPTDAQAPVPDDEPPAPPEQPRDANVYDDGYGRFEEVTTPGRVTALAVMHFVYCGLLSVCGVLSSVLLRAYPTLLPGPDVLPSQRVYAHALHGLMVVASVVLLVAGMTTLRRRPAARVWSVVAMSVAGLLLLLNLGDMVLNLPVCAGRPGEMVGVFFGVIYHLVFWLGYLIPVGSLLASGGRDRPAEDAPVSPPAVW